MTFTNEFVTQLMDRVNVKDLYACTLLNRQFHTVANPYLYRSLDIKTDKQLQQLMSGLTSTRPRMGPLVRRVQLDGFITNKHLLTVMARTLNLKALVLEDATKITDAAFQRLPRRLPHLTSLSVRTASRITLRSLHALGQHCPNLTALCLESCRGFSANLLFDTLVICCPRLRELSVDVGALDDLPLPGGGGPTVGGVTLDAHSVACKCAFNLSQLKQLTSLTLRDCPPALSQHLLMTKKYKRVDGHRPPEWPQLVSFSLGSCSGLKDSHVLDFVLAHTRMRHLTLEAASISDATLHAMRTHLTDLTTLGLAFNSQISARGLRRLVCGCAHLTHVNVYRGGIVADQFPEAGAACVNGNPLNGVGGVLTLAHLDQQAITGIRRTGLLHDGGDDHHGTFHDDDDDDESVMDIVDGLAFSQRSQTWQWCYVGHAVGRMNRMDRMQGGDDHIDFTLTL